jgi:hypothetical protein
MVINSVYAMKRLREVENKVENNEIISFKSLCGFPFTTIRNNKCGFHVLSQHKKNEVYERIMHHNDTCLLTLFNVATLLPLELQKVIVNKIFNDNENAARKFLNKPIVDALESYAWSEKKDLSQRPYNSLALESCKYPLTRDRLFEYSKEFMIFNNVYNKHKRMCSKNELESLVTLNETFELHKYQFFYIKYQFYKRLTLKNIVKECNKEQLVGLFLMLALYVTTTLPAWGDEVLDQNVIDYNQAAKAFNAEAVRMCREEGRCGATLLECKNEYIKLPNRFLLIKTLSWIPVMVPLMLVLERWQEKTKKSAVECAMFGISFLSLYTLIGTQFEQGCPWSCMAGLYALMCCGYNVMKMYSWQDGSECFGKVAQLLQRTDIVIK